MARLPRVQACVCDTGINERSLRPRPQSRPMTATWRRRGSCGGQLPLQPLSPPPHTHTLPPCAQDVSPTSQLSGSEGGRQTNPAPPSRMTYGKQTSPHTSPYKSQVETPVLLTLPQCPLHASSLEMFPGVLTTAGCREGALLVETHWEPTRSSCHPFTSVSPSVKWGQ